MSGLYEVTEESMILAHKAGQDYFKRNLNSDPSENDLAMLGRSLHWHDADNYAFIAGYFGAKHRLYG